MNYPQTNYPPPQGQPQPQAAPPAMGAGAQNLAGQAQQQVFMEVAAQPQRNPVVRERIDDGVHVIHLTSVEMKPSQKDGRLMLLWTFEVVNSTVPQAIGHAYGFPMFWSNRFQLQDLSDIAKEIWGQQQVMGWASQGVTPNDVAASIASTVTGMHCKLTTRRNIKDNESYDTAFINHTFREFRQAAQEIELPKAIAPVSTPTQPQGPMPVPPPVAQPPVAQPPVAQPPVAQPPVAQPPVAQPPVAQPPVAQPPVAQPPVAQPPVAQPPATAAPFPAPPMQPPF